MKKLLGLALTSVAALYCNLAQAGLNVPYTLDADTMHLWHFDTGTAVGSFTTEADAVANNPITLTNYGLPSSGPPYTNIYPTNVSAISGLGGSLFIATNAGTSGGTEAMAAGPQDMAATNFCNSVTGAFTFEALVYIQGNITSASAGLGEWEIFCGDNSVGTRGWQFRLQNENLVPIIDFNFISATGGTALNFSTNLPVTGPDAVAAGSWYHAAITYTGNSPTNSDPPGQLTFYWTLFNPNRTTVDFLAATNIVAGGGTAGTLGGTPSPAVGGSQRTTHGVGNDGSLQGLIDEVRISDIARQPTNMAFNSTVVPTAPSVSINPPANTLIGFGQTLSINPIFNGSSLSFQWQEKNGSGVWTNLATQTGNTLTIPNIPFAASGSYWLIASNAISTATTTVANVTVGVIPGELFNTGIDTNGFYDTALAGLPDPHYTLTQSADINHLGPNAIVWNMSEYPIAANGGEFANIDGISQWIGTAEDSYTSPAGGYTYHTAFLMDGVDPSQPMTINGTIWMNTGLTDVLLNGNSTGNHPTQNADPNLVASFAITNGYLPGLNTLDFLVTNLNPNGSYQESAVKIEMTAIGQPLPAGKPTILKNPAPVTVSDYNASGGVTATAAFSVVATGRPPLTYQWLDQNSSPISGATNRTLSFLDPTAGSPAATSFKCVISNASGAVTSTAASLTLVSSNLPVVFPLASYEIYTNQTLLLNVSTLLESGSNPDGLALTFDTMDGTGTNANLAATITLTGDVISYVPVSGVIGSDSFTYTFFDAVGNTYTGTNLIKVVSPLPPTFSAVSLSTSTNVVLKGSGGTPGAPYYILSTANVTNAVTNWTVVGSNVFSGSGGFSITNAINSGTPVQFFTIQVPQ